MPRPARRAADAPDAHAWIGELLGEEAMAHLAPGAKSTAHAIGQDVRE